MIYENGPIKVDNHFARFGSKSYAIDKINSVDVRVETKPGCLWAALAVIAGICFFAAIGSGALVSWVTFAAFAGLAALAFVGRPKPKYHLMLATSSGEVQASTAGDRETVVELRRAIESAMMQRV